MRLFCATTNPGKLREFRAASGADIQIEPLPGLRAIDPPEETGLTFEENAILKALYYGAQAPEGGYLFAEDSGLEVDELCGEPGVHSARFAGPDASDEDNNRLLIDRLAHSPDRAARYVCVIALVKNSELSATFRGTVEGEIVREPRGTSGFGYDPLFLYPPFGLTFGETPADLKAEVSHRAKALAAMFTALRAPMP